jgi:alpha-glucosidase
MEYPNKQVAGKVLKAEIQDDKLIIDTENKVKISIELITEEIARIRYAPESIFEADFSYAVESKEKSNEVNRKFNDFKHHIEYKTSSFIVNINKANSKITFTNQEARIICRDADGFEWEEDDQNGGNTIKLSKVIQEGEHFYGLGDKPMHLNLRGQRLTNWAMDTYGFKKNEDPIYKCIPFYTSCHSEIAYGIFFDNTFKSYFDFGTNSQPVASFSAEGGEMNYYFINGPELLDVTRRYTELTGVPEMPPMWALGYQQCKWSYYPEEKVKEVTNQLRELKIPCDAFYLDIDYMDGFRCFTWDKEKFPNPKKMITELKENGFKTVVIIDPGIKIDDTYAVYNEGLENDFFCKRADGPYVKGKVWPGDCYFPDFTNPKVRTWWEGLYEELISDIGVSGIWNDMNEPAILEVESKTLPNDVRHDYDGNTCSHRKAHNIYGMQMTRATYDGVKKFNNGKRPLVITRSAYAGTQRYASAWTGDNIATWEHLWLANVQCQRLSISGFSFAGSDVGGFIDQPTPELYIRWVQLACFHPFFRTHSSGDHGDQEPWSFGEEALNISRKYIEFRYQLLPYLYTCFYQYVKEYTPILRPISIFDQHDKDTLYRGDEFLLGDHLLICPVLVPNANSRYVYLPKGKWYNYWSDQLVEGGKEVMTNADLQTIPLYVKEGAVIPFHPVMQYVGEFEVSELTLHAYFGGSQIESTLYEDEGDGYRYKEGIYNIKKFVTDSTNTSFKLIQNKKGHYDVSYKKYKIQVHGLPFVPSNILVNGAKLSMERQYFEKESLVLIIDSDAFHSLEIIK